MAKKSVSEMVVGAGNIFRLTVDYGRSVERGVMAGKYDRIPYDYVIFPSVSTRRKGTAEVKVEFIHFGRRISPSKAFRELGMMGYRPAGVHELLTLGERYPDVQREFPVVTLGYTCKSRWCGTRGFLCLCVVDSERTLSVHWIERGNSDFNERCRFAAVRK